MIRLNEKGDRITFEVIVQPRAGRNKVVSELDGALKVKIAAPPVQGRANSECQRFLAKLLGLSRADIEIIWGATANRKRIRVRGLTRAVLAQKMKSILGP